MAFDELHIYEGDNEDALQQKKLKLNAFRTYAKKMFQDNLQDDRDYLQFIKVSTQLYSYRLPDGLGEQFIRFETAPFFWLCDTPAVVKYEEWLKSESRNRNTPADNYKTLKEYYSKWAVFKSESEKKYYALSIVKIGDLDTIKNNVLKILLHATTLIFDNSLFDPAKAIELINTAKEKLENQRVEEWIKEDLQYIIRIFLGFALMKDLNFEEANNVFSDALQIKTTGINAKYYCAVCNMQLDQPGLAMVYLSEMVEFDKSRIRLALQNNSITLLSFFIRNAVIHHVFFEEIFAELHDDLETLFAQQSPLSNFFIEEIDNILTNVQSLSVEEYISIESGKNLEFLKKIYSQFKGNKNFFVSISSDYLFEKVLGIFSSIMANINSKLISELKNKLEIFDKNITENSDVIKHLLKEKDEVKERTNKALQESLLALDTKMNAAISAIEHKIEELPNLKQFDPQAAFNNSMVYNSIVSMLIFVIGGFSGCYRGSINDLSDFKSVFSTVFVSGIKWSAITFLIGMIISTFSAAFAFMERSNEKQKLIRRISFLKNQKEKEVEQLRKENEKRLKSIIDNISDRIVERENDIEKLKKEKAEREGELKQETDRISAEYKSKIDNILAKYGSQI